MAASDTSLTDLSHAMVTTPVQAADWLIVVPVVFPLFAGALLLMLRRKTAIHTPYAMAVMSLHFLASVGLLFDVIANGAKTMTMGSWLPPFGISFSADVLGALLTATASFVTLICIDFSAHSIDKKLKRNGFFVFVIIMLGGVSGAFITGDIFNMYVWFEVLLISSFGLITIGGEKLQLDGAIKYTFLNFIATTLFLIATGLLYGATGTLNMADLTLRLREVNSLAPIYTIAILYFVAFAMKAAAFPLNFWLPASYHTPRIIVSALFAGLLTKVGIYALLRTIVMLFGTQMPEFAIVIAIVGAATMLVGIMGALAQTDIRRIAGYLVVSGIGVMIVGIALSNEMALSGTIFYAIHSMIAMTALYLVIAIIGIRANTYDLRQLGGFYAAAPWFSAGFLILGFAVAGLPPFSGFWPKYLLVRASINVGEWWIAGFILLTGFLTTIAVFRIWIYAFWRGGPEATRDGAESWTIEELPSNRQLSVNVSVGILVVLVILMGVKPIWLIDASLSAGKGLLFPKAYIESVFGENQ